MVGVKTCRGRGGAGKVTASQTGTAARAAAPPTRGSQLPGARLSNGPERHQSFVGHYNPRQGEYTVEVPPGGRIPGPSTGIEVMVPGRQGIRAQRDINPACGSANLLGTSPRGLSRS